MRPFQIAFLFLCLPAVAALAADEPAGKAVLTLHGQVRIDDPAKLAAVRDLGLELLGTSNFNTAAHADVLKKSVPEIHERYRAAVAGDYLLITFPRPVPVQTTGGRITASEVVIGLGSDRADALFTIDEAGRVVDHAKYDGARAIRLRDAATSLLKQIARKPA